MSQQQKFRKVKLGMKTAKIILRNRGIRNARIQHLTGPWYGFATDTLAGSVRVDTWGVQIESI